MLDSKSDAELGAMMRDRFTRLAEAKDMGLCDEHPVHQFNRDNAVLRAHRVAKDAAGSGLGARTLEETDDPRPQTATDDPPPTPSTPRPPVREGGSVAAHDAAIALDAVIPGLNRIRGPYTHTDTRVVDEDRIVQPRGRSR
jgi:hypothetical protein